jgi:hypothetical protein
LPAVGRWWAREALRLFRQGADRCSEAMVITHLGDTHYATGELAAARTTWGQAFTILRALGGNWTPRADRFSLGDR